MFMCVVWNKAKVYPNAIGLKFSVFGIQVELL